VTEKNDASLAVNKSRLLVHEPFHLLFLKAQEKLWDETYSGQLMLTHTKSLRKEKRLFHFKLH